MMYPITNDVLYNAKTIIGLLESLLYAILMLLTLKEQIVRVPILGQNQIEPLR